MGFRYTRRFKLFHKKLQRMKYIAHRGNINSKNIERENSPEYIKEALDKGYDVEVDIWYVDDKFFFGHDKPQYEVDMWKFYKSTEFSKIWFHCKNNEALFVASFKWFFKKYFWHENDDFTLTSDKYIWTYPGKELTYNSICVLPETVNYTENELKICAGICSDFIENYKN